MYCENCGSQVSQNDNFCTNCGAQIIKNTVQELAAGIINPTVEQTVRQPVYSPKITAKAEIPASESVPGKTEISEADTTPVALENPVYGSSDPDYPKYAARSKKQGTSAIVIILAVIAAMIIIGIAATVIFKNFFGFLPKNNNEYYKESIYDLPDDYFDGIFDEKTDIDDFTLSDYTDKELENVNNLCLDDYDIIIHDVVDRIDKSGISFTERERLLEYSRAVIWDLDGDGLDEFVAVYSTDGYSVRYVLSRYNPKGSGGFHTRQIDDQLMTYDVADDIWAAVCTATVDGKDCLAVIYEDRSIDNFLSSEIYYYIPDGSGYELWHTAGAQIRTDTESFDYDSYYFDDDTIDYDKWNSLIYDDMKYIVVEYGTTPDASGVSFRDFVN